MANEISVSLSLRVDNGNHSEAFQSSGKKFDQTVQGAVGGIVSIGTATETLSLGDVITAGYAAFQNLSTATAGTAYIAIGPMSGTNLMEFGALRRGQPSVIPLTGTVTVGAKAYGSALPMRYVIFSE